MRGARIWLIDEQAQTRHRSSADKAATERDRKSGPDFDHLHDPC
jgi:hypothetical protein